MAATETLQKKDHAPAGDDLREQIETLKSDFAELSESIRSEAKKGLEKAQDEASDKLEDLEAYIRRKPVHATAIAAGIGFLIGAIMSK